MIVVLLLIVAVIALTFCDKGSDKAFEEKLRQSRGRTEYRPFCGATWVDNISNPNDNSYNVEL